MGRMINTFVKRIIICLCILAIMAPASGCGRAEDSEGMIYKVYYIAQDENSIVPIDVVVDDDIASDDAKLISFLMKQLVLAQESTDYYAPLGEKSSYRGFASGENQVSVDFSSDYYISENDIRKVLIRAAVTRTLTQVKGVKSVNFTVDNMSMVDSTGNPIGPMSADSFLDNAGAQINAEERTALTLYFANESGSLLKKTTRTVNYSGNISMDKLVVEQLLSGPLESESAYPVLGPDVEVINVTTQDGTCYVNLNAAFLSPTVNVSNEVYIYSIVDSLVELGTVNKVQFLINSESNVIFREVVDLNTQFSRNLDIVEE